ncbi:hypothetical protein ACFL5M_06440 [Candidatus Neomarinimicrobiota bacterium]
MDMYRRSRSWPGIMLIAMSIFLVAGVVAADDYPLKREFDVQYGGKLIVDTDRGSINIKTTKKKVVVVEITRKVLGDFLSDSDEILADWEIDFDQSGGDVRIIAKSRSDWNWSACISISWFRSNITWI